MFSQTDGFYLEGLTIDSQTYNAGDTIDDHGSDSTVQDVIALGARHGSGTPVDPANVFDVRVSADCNPSPSSPLYGVYHSGNVVNDVVVDGQGIGGNNDLDISCQRNDLISNVVDTGHGLGLYIDQDVTVDNDSFTPGGPNPGFRGWDITASSNITIDGFTTTGEGGRINSPSYPSSDITIENELMETPGQSIVIGDSRGVSIDDSTLQHMVIDPTDTLQGLTVESTPVATVSCDALARASTGSIIGITC